MHRTNAGVTDEKKRDRPRGGLRSLLLALPFLWIVSSAAADFNSLDLSAPPAFRTGQDPVFVENADFNGDGIIDLAVSERTDRSVSIFAGDGEGGFTRIAACSTSHYAYNCTVCDLNGDGILDLVVPLRYWDSVDILIGGGTGSVWDSTFATAVSFYSGEGAYDAAVGDFNGDSVIDLAVVNDGLAMDRADSVSIFIGTDTSGVWDGGFENPYGYTVDHTPQMVIASDFNEDGILDLATANAHGNNVSVLIGNGEEGTGDGTFQERVDYTVGSGPHSVIAEDFNEDGILDLASSNWNVDNVTVLLGNGSGGVGDGTFAAGTNYNVGDAPRRVVVADFDSDGILDLATCNYYGRTVSVLRGDGSGGVGNGQFLSAGTFGCGGMPWSLTADHFDADSNCDIVTVNSLEDGGYFHRGNGDGTVLDLDFENTGQYPEDVVTGDWNGDLLLDLAVACRDDDIVSILIGGADGGFTPSANFSVGNGPVAIVSGDFNSDDILDLATAEQIGTSVSILIGTDTAGTGDGNFASAVTYTLSGAPSAIVTADFNKDGITDLAISEPLTDAIEILLGDGTGGNGDGTFTSVVSVPGVNGPEGIVIEDFDGDGILDIAAAASGDDEVSIVTGSGSGNVWDSTFASAIDYPVGSSPLGIIAEDWSGDGILDLALSNNGDSTISVLIGNGSGGVGDGTFSAAVSYSVDPGPAGLLAADLDGDCVLDLVVANRETGTAAILCGNGTLTGDGTFGDARVFGIGQRVTAVVSGNFDSVGGIDLAFVGNCYYPSLTDRVKIVLNNTEGENVSVSEGVPRRTSLSLQNRPNPFNPLTTIRYELGEPGRACVSVYTSTGRLVRTLEDDYRRAGIHDLQWDGTDANGLPVGSGVYMVRVESGGMSGTVKALLLR